MNCLHEPDRQVPARPVWGRRHDVLHGRLPLEWIRIHGEPLRRPEKELRRLLESLAPPRNRRLACAGGDDRHRRSSQRRRSRAPRGDLGRGRRPVQAARLRLPVLGDLRGARFPPTTTATTASCSRTTSRRSGGGPWCRSATTWSPSTRRSSCIPARLGGLGPPGGLHRPAGRLPHLQAALPRRQARGRRVRAEAVRASRRARRVRSDRAAPVQPDVQDSMPAR